MRLVAGRRLWPAAVAAGLVAGALSVLPYEGTSGTLHLLGNSAALWLLLAFGLGTVAGSRSGAALAGLAVLLAVVCGFYLVLHLLYPGDGFGRVALFWLIMAAIGGPVYGTLGAIWRAGPDAARGVTAAAVGAAFLAEAVLFTQTLPVQVAEGALGIGLAAGLARRRRRSVLFAACAFPVLVLAGLLGWLVTRYAAHLYFAGPDR
jgi:Family of unknown function (DUF6518)